MRPVLWVCSHLRIRWYWLLLANNVAFMVREFAVISLFKEGWTWEVIVADAAIWLTLLLVAWEVWRFSEIRPRSPKTVDQVLDMIVLPLNYGMFCAVCVRILKLQHTEENEEMVAAVIDSADIWESWALWSVLELFVLVVENAAKRDPRRVADTEYLDTIKNFKTLSLMGVKSFFLILFAFVSLDIAVKGLIAPAVPTFCYWVYTDCMSCRDWYHLHVNPVAQSIIYIMCSFALIFVFTFERMFSEYLHCIQPYWKFWGVKLVVSVTYFQWLVISYGFRLENRQVYLVHCLLCCVEMPLLAILHCTCAYPYGKAWLDSLLDHVPAEPLEVAETLAETGELEQDNDGALSERGDVVAAQGRDLGSAIEGAPDPDSEGPSVSMQPMPDDGRCQSFALDADDADDSAQSGGTHGAVALASPGDELPHAALAESSEEESGMVGTSQEEFAPRYFYSLILYFLIGIGLVYGCIRLIFDLDPPESDLDVGKHVYEFTCSQSDLGKYVEQKEENHWLLPSTGEGQLEIKGTAGVWLPLCGSTLAACNIGYQGSPTISCDAQGEYSWKGLCQEVVCGPPLKLPHAVARYDHQAWRVAMKVKYDCDNGYAGSPSAICGKDGNYTVTGECEQVVCPSPPVVHHATLPSDTANRTWTEGDWARYQCDFGYHGQPAAQCGVHEVWAMSGRCQVLCETPPVLPHAIPQFDPQEHDIQIGTRLKYKCAVGYGGQPVVVCDELGKYQVEGSCELVCGTPMDLAHGIARIDIEQAKRGYKVGASIKYWCDPGYGGDPVAKCGAAGQWIFGKVDQCTYSGCGSLDAFLSANVSSSWQDEMDISEKLNFTSSDYGDVVFFKCKLGYSGKPMATCQHGHWQLAGNCAVTCGPPPQIAHSNPSFNVNKAGQGWTVGMHVRYRCEVGYGGNPIAECAADGRWTFGDTDKCVDYGCGQLDDFLTTSNPNWADTMRISDAINVTESDYGDVVFFKCLPGYGGRPLATCTTGKWHMTDTCSPFSTSLGCTCKTEWTHCSGMMGSDCLRWHGCTTRALGENYGWCEVKDGSCPSGSGTLWGQSASWDYCAASESQNSEHVPPTDGYIADVGPPMALRLLLYFLLCVGGAGLGFYVYRYAKAYRSRRTRGHDAGDYSFRSAGGMSLPELPDVRGRDPEALLTLGNETSSETSSPEQLPA